MLKADPRFSKTAVMGLSEGSTIAIIAAQQEKLQALVSLAGPAINAADGLLQQLKGHMTAVQAQKRRDTE